MQAKVTWTDTGLANRRRPSKGDRQEKIHDPNTASLWLVRSRRSDTWRWIRSVGRKQEQKKIGAFDPLGKNGGYTIAGARAVAAKLDAEFEVQKETIKTATKGSALAWSVNEAFEAFMISRASKHTGGTPDDYRRAWKLLPDDLKSMRVVDLTREIITNVPQRMTCANSRARYALGRLNSALLHAERKIPRKLYPDIRGAIQDALDEPCIEHVSEQYPQFASDAEWVTAFNVARDVWNAQARPSPDVASAWMLVALLGTRAWQEIGALRVADVHLDCEYPHIIIPGQGKNARTKTKNGDRKKRRMRDDYIKFLGPMAASQMEVQLHRARGDKVFPANNKQGHIVEQSGFVLTNKINEAVEQRVVWHSLRGFWSEKMTDFPIKPSVQAAITDHCVAATDIIGRKYNKPADEQMREADLQVQAALENLLK